MPVALVATSHSPLIGLNDPTTEIRDEVRGVLDDARAFVRDFDPELVVMFAPDHYNGFFYDMMPPFCIGASAHSVGDYGLPTGDLSVDKAAAYDIGASVLAQGVDLAISEDMQVDHGFVQPLLFLFDTLQSVPIVPIFINCVASPLGPARRSMDLGSAVGAALADDDRRILLVGSGGLSHDPPVPRMEDAAPEVIERLLLRGRNPSTEQRATREEKTVKAARAYAAGEAGYRELNPEWDKLVLDALSSGDFARIVDHDNDWFVREGGHSSHEIRTWIAAYAALSGQGPYQVQSRYYRPIKEWFAGFSTTIATPASALAHARVSNKGVVR
ncbi:3-carboxyethylcatechol 2,3-dioxygenase [Hoyosella subflava]|uniref:2,3-dihydroxyphenylpropionate/2,3-dihydroxicinnamic acid 1,2-dioxygenase n=1 Tax=Hoyosella subflava (strain DSM 45089 / JCM 17490 / NBRC 109087 / DQS3-9A1) TaxID=443218 RepID=F6EF48_HOYSD|nr:3-carboxyethylcatechol 2,3-dioxygenase [Hoyosella subflava]AEF38627.1 OhpD [Hoyosella subflava DQS3-9A1]